MEVAGRTPTPSQEVQAGDRFSRMLKGRSEEERKMLELRRNGLTFTEIGATLKCHEAVVRRLIMEMARREKL